MIELHIYGMLAILEVLLLVSVTAGWLYVRNRRNSRDDHEDCRGNRYGKGGSGKGRGKGSNNRAAGRR